MTQLEFKAMSPDIIGHPQWGYGTRQFIANGKLIKGVAYRNRDDQFFAVQLGSSWNEVYQKLTAYMNLHQKTKDQAIV